MQPLPAARPAYSKPSEKLGFGEETSAAGNEAVQPRRAQDGILILRQQLEGAAVTERGVWRRQPAAELPSVEDSSHLGRHPGKAWPERHIDGVELRHRQPTLALVLETDEFAGDDTARERTETRCVFPKHALSNVVAANQPAMVVEGRAHARKREGSVENCGRLIH
jgi:hypothetical protein